jgi:hypothetical protein
MFENDGKALVVGITRRVRCLGLCRMQAVEAEGSRTGEFWRAKRFHAWCDRGARTSRDYCRRIQSWNECGLRTLCRTRWSVGNSGRRFETIGHSKLGQSAHAKGRAQLGGSGGGGRNERE